MEIHEFSTGINAERLSDGGWRSRGFRVGEYMNLTLPDIPNVVKRAIANKRFEVFKDRHSQEPSFVGWVLPSTENEEDDWSVVTVVTSGQDEGGRSTSFYRYFLCEGRDSLWKILAWMEHYQQKSGGKWPVFDPFASKQLGESHQWNVNAKPKLKLPDDWQSFLNENDTPVILSLGYASDLQMINAMAEVKANGEQVSWAYNVEVIEHPEQFTIIQAANEQSYQSLMQKRQSQANNARLMPLSVDEAAIKTAINGLIGGSQVRDEWIQSILATLEGNQLTVEQWEAVFDDQGAGMAIKRGSADRRMGRLLTLRAFVLPETLPEFLEWLKIQGKKNKETSQQQVSIDFQYQLKNKLNKFEQHFTEGINKVLKALIIEQSIPATAAVWLLTETGSIWAPYRYRLMENVRTDLNTINNSFSSNNRQPEPQRLRCEKDIWGNLCVCWNNYSYRSVRYKPFAELFAQLGKSGSINEPSAAYELSAYFYQVSEGKVPTEIFKGALPREGSDEGTILGLKVERKIPLPENAGRFVKSNALCIGIMFMSWSGMMLVLGYKYGFEKGLAKGSVGQQTSENYRITGEKKRRALEKFPKTVEEIENIVSELTRLKDQGTETEPSRDYIIKEIKNTLVVNEEESEELDYKKATSTGLLGLVVDWWSGEIAAAQEKWVEAIYIYQKSKQKLSANGYIEPGKETAKSLKCDVANSLELTPIEICRQQNERRQNTQQNVTAMTEKQKQEAKAAFLKRTYPAITQILTELQEELSYLKIDGESIHRAIRETLGVSDADYGKARKGEAQGVEALSPAIYNYQGKKTDFPADGIIDIPKRPSIDPSKRNTFDVLKEEVMEKIRSNPNKYKVTGGQ